MGLDLTALVSTAFAIASSAIDGAVESLTFRKVTPGYTVSSGEPNDTNADTTGVRAVRKSSGLRELVSGNPGLQLEAQDRVYLLPAEDLGATVPAVSDQLLLSDGSTWEVFWTKAPPGSPLFTVAVRRP
jgi:hypothetical protein